MRCPQTFDKRRVWEVDKFLFTSWNDTTFRFRKDLQVSQKKTDGVQLWGVGFIHPIAQCSR